MTGTRFANVLMSVLIVLLATLLGWATWAAVTGRGASHEQILDHQMRVEQQLTYLSCLLLIVPEDRTPDAVAACQVDP